MYKNILSFILLFSILMGIFLPTHGATPEDSCNQQTGYQLYNCRVKSICDELYKPKKIIFNTQETEEQKYLELEEADTSFLEVNKQKYRENMNSLYSCALIQAQTNALNEISKTGLNIDPKVADKIETRIEDRLEKLKEKAKSLNCAGIEKEEVFSKLQVLQQSTYEICRYINYLDYLDEYSDTLSNLITEETSVVKATKIVTQTKNDIQDELNHTIKVFPLAYTAYSQYENFIAIHFILELLREDFIIFRKRLQQVLLPINQVMYKVKNSMQTPK